MPEKRVYLKGTFELIIKPVKKDELGALPLAHYLATPEADSPTYDFVSPYGDEISLPIPEGSIRAYVEKHKKDFDFPEPHIKIGAKYHRVPGEKTPIPEGAKVVRGGPPD